MKNPSDFWKTLNKISRKEAKGNEEVMELISDFENIVKHVQGQGECKNINLDFQNKIIQEVSNLEKEIKFKFETDKPITIGEIKIVLKALKQGKTSGPDGIINELF